MGKERSGAAPDGAGSGGFRLRRGEEVAGRMFADCHGGTGAVQARLLLTEAEAAYTGLRLLHDDVLPPGAEIGLHGHPDGCGEYYYLLAGVGEMDHGAGWEPVRAGDLGYAPPGRVHAVRNTGTEPLRLLVIGLSAAPS